MSLPKRLPSLWSAVFLALLVVPASGQSPGRKTLLQWSYGTSFEGGADLTEPLVTDRPDFTESSVTVGYRVAQLEMGYTYSYDSGGDGSVRSHSFPETLLRIGMLADWFELRLDWNYIEERRNEFGGPIDTASGAEDMGVGCKLALTPQEGVLPETALVLQTTVPSGSTKFTADEMQPGVTYLYSWEINESLTTGGQSLVNRARDESTDDAYVLLSQSWTVGTSWTDRIGSYVEWFVLAPTSADTDHTEHYLDGGFTVLANDDIQWDIRAGLGLNGADDDYFVGSGVSVRWK